MQTTTQAPAQRPASLPADVPPAQERTHIPTRDFFEALGAHQVTPTTKAPLLSRSEIATANRHTVHGIDISLCQEYALHSIWLGVRMEGHWLEPFEALEVADKLRSVANQSILLRAQAAVETTASAPTPLFHHHPKAHP